MEGPQIVIRFHGEMAKSIVISYLQQSVNLKSIDITGPRVRLMFEGDVSTEQPTSALYGVLQKGEELWELR